MKSEILEYFHSTLTYAEIGDIFNLTGSRIGQIFRSNFTKEDLENRLQKVSTHKSNEYSLDPSWTSLYESCTLSISMIAEKLGVPPSHLYRAVENNYSEEYRKKHWDVIHDGRNRIGENHPLHGTTWGVPPEHRGSYIRIRKPDGTNGLEHSLMYKEALGIESYGGLHGDLVVHHIDYNRSNNDPSNLIMVTPSTHMKIHKGSITLSNLSDKSYICDGHLVSQYLKLTKLPNTVVCYNLTGVEDVTLNDIGLILKQGSTTIEKTS